MLLHNIFYAGLVGNCVVSNLQRVVLRIEYGEAITVFMMYDDDTRIKLACRLLLKAELAVRHAPRWPLNQIFQRRARR